MDIEQQLLLQELATVMSSAEGRPRSAAEAKTWTLQQWTQDLFPVSLITKEPCCAWWQACKRGRGSRLYWPVNELMAIDK